MIEYKGKNFTRNKKRKTSVFSRWLFYFSGLSFFGVIIYVLFFSLLVAISSVEISGNKYVDRDLILEEVNAQISGKFLWVIDRNNFFLVRRSQLKKNILDRFRQVREVRIKNNFNTKLEIEIIERIPTVIICRASCFVADENGQIYDEYDASSDLEKKYNLIRLEDENRKEIFLGEIVLEKEYIEYLKKIKEELSAEVNLEVENTFHTPGIISRDVRVKTLGGWEIFFSSNIKIEKEIEMLKVVLKNEIGENRQADLEYVDLRIDNKVFYKFRENTPSEIARKEAEEKSALPEQSATSDKDKKKD